MTHPVDDVLRDWEAKHGDDLRTLVLTEMAGIHDDVRFIHALVVTRQPGLGFLSVEAAKVQDDLIRAERRDRARHAREGVKPSGVVPAPGSVTAFSLLAEWSHLLADVEQSITTRLLRAGVCHVTTHRAGDDDNTRFIRVSELIRVTTRRRYLERLHTDLVDFHGRVTRCIDGNQIKAMPDPCPWCHRMTLIANLTTGVIRCERDPHTGDYASCLCSDSYCQCKTTTKFRHEWRRDEKAHKSTSWQGLRSAINAHTSDTSTEGHSR